MAYLLIEHCGPLALSHTVQSGAKSLGVIEVGFRATIETAISYMKMLPFTTMKASVTGGSPQPRTGQ